MLRTSLNTSDEISQESGSSPDIQQHFAQSWKTCADVSNYKKGDCCSHQQVDFEKKELKQWFFTELLVPEIFEKRC